MPKVEPLPTLPTTEMPSAYEIFDDDLLELKTYIIPKLQKEIDAETDDDASYLAGDIEYAHHLVAHAVQHLCLEGVGPSDIKQILNTSVKQEIDYHEKYLRDEANIFSKQKKEVMPNGKIL